MLTKNGYLFAKIRKNKGKCKKIGEKQISDVLFNKKSCRKIHKKMFSCQAT